MSIMKLLDQIDQEFAAKYSPSTIARYRPVIVSYVKWLLETQGLKSHEALSQTGFNECTEYLNTLPVQSASKRNQTIAALSALYKVIRHPLNLAPLRARQKYHTIPDYILTPEQVNKLVYHLNYPHKIIAWLMYASGLTLSECLLLTASDIHLKDSRAGRAEISEWTAKRFELWLEDNLLKPNEPLFKLKPHHFNQVLKRASKNTGLPHLSSMVLRYSGVVRLYEAGRSEAYIRRWLGVGDQTFKRRYAKLKPGQ